MHFIKHLVNYLIPVAELFQKTGTPPTHSHLLLSDGSSFLLSDGSDLLLIG